MKGIDWLEELSRTTLMDVVLSIVMFLMWFYAVCYHTYVREQFKEQDCRIRVLEKQVEILAKERE